MAYILIEYSMMIQKVSGNGNFTTKRNSVRQNYNEITQTALASLKEVTEKTDRLLWRCDPSPHIHKVTYDEVTRLLQGYIENEVDLNTDGSCSRTCADYHNTTSKSCSDEKFCAQQPKCSGRIHDCQFIDSIQSVCQSPENSTRRYEYVKYGERKYLGKNEKCWRDVNKVQSWKKWYFTECTYCFCLCDEQRPKSDRYFNLRETLSDVNANKVVTGVSGVFTSSPEWTDYLEFTNIGMLMDVAQSTIPYIDIQDVASIPPVALAGIGIYYKHRGLNGGFVAPQIISYDLSPHLSLIPN
ncbi:uncharacterized protein LOC117566449 [Drosophila albomicans]|uniref:Uncharacterized protein LOC117566449 n=1 Tax=Drosophila albomicans TaxID=7291 RepID=A0A6P8WTZ5_DROAB|nr:uncharacterized protein LOC117566449 [Drosophila albomicans]